MSDYLIRWTDNGELKMIKGDNAGAAFAAARILIEGGRPGVEVRMPDTNSVVRGRAILDICDEIRGFAAHRAKTK